jgi:hypothetical protein
MNASIHRARLPRAKLFRAAASDDPTTPPQHVARVLRRLAAPHQTGFLLPCQRHYGNAYVQRMIASRDNGHASPPEQDVTEEEPIARRIAAPDVATAGQASSIGGLQNHAVQANPLTLSISPIVPRQKAKDDEEDKQIQSNPAGSPGGNFDAGEEVEARLSQSKGGGSPLPESVRDYMEPRFGADFSDVDVHTDSDTMKMSRNVGARAFTHDSDIYFGVGHSPSNLALTGHELTHVVQQTGRSTRSTQHPPTVQRQESKNPGKKIVSAPVSPPLRTGAKCGSWSGHPARRVG